MFDFSKRPCPMELKILGDENLMTGNIHEAIKYYQKAVEKDPGLAVAWNNMGAAYGKRNHHEQALQYYNRALEINPSYVKALYGKTAALKNLGKWGEALNIIDPLLINNHEQGAFELRSSIITRRNNFSAVNYCRSASGPGTFVERQVRPRITIICG